MKVELIKNTHGLQEIWADNQHIRVIPRKKGEEKQAYDDRCEQEYNDYCESLKNVARRKGNGTVRKSTDI